jgi:hypothetical protein
MGETWHRLEVLFCYQSQQRTRLHFHGPTCRTDKTWYDISPLTLSEQKIGRCNTHPEGERNNEIMCRITQFIGSQKKRDPWPISTLFSESMFKGSGVNITGCLYTVIFPCFLI